MKKTNKPNVMKTNKNEMSQAETSFHAFFLLVVLVHRCRTLCTKFPFVIAILNHYYHQAIHAIRRALCSVRASSHSPQRRCFNRPVTFIYSSNFYGIFSAFFTFSQFSHLLPEIWITSSVFSLAFLNSCIFFHDCFHCTE